MWKESWKFLNQHHKNIKILHVKKKVMKIDLFLNLGKLLEHSLSASLSKQLDICFCPLTVPQTYSRNQRSSKRSIEALWWESLMPLPLLLPNLCLHFQQPCVFPEHSDAIYMPFTSPRNYRGSEEIILTAKY